MNIQLDPTIPVTVEGHGDGDAVALLDYGSVSDLMWLVFLQSDGSSIIVPNNKIKKCT